MANRTVEELENYSFLPLYTSEVWEDYADDESVPWTTPGEAYASMIHASMLTKDLRARGGNQGKFQKWSSDLRWATYGTEFFHDVANTFVAGIPEPYLQQHVVDGTEGVGQAWAVIGPGTDERIQAGNLWSVPHEIDPRADLGDKNSNHRKWWWQILGRGNRILKKIRLLGLDAEFGPAWEALVRELTDTLGARNDTAKKATFLNRKELFHGLYSASNPPGFTLEKGPGDRPGYYLTPFNIMKHLAYVHDKMFGSHIWDHGMNPSTQHWRIKQETSYSIIRNLERGHLVLEQMMSHRDDLLEQAIMDAEVALVAGAGEDFQLQMLSDDEVDLLSEREGYLRYFATTFNQDVITFVPIIHNFHLTTKYFQNINDAFVAPNNLALDMLISTIKNDDFYRATPDLSRPQAQATIASQLGKQRTDHAAAAREFILKMLIMAPINILKGLCELIDPHVALSKLIKVGTGQAFNELSKVLQGPADGINEARKASMEALVEGSSEGQRGIDGEDLLTFILCIIDFSMKGIEEGVDDVPPGFFPRIKKTGIDFLGTGSGLLMLPPLPFGLIYLLLGLIKFGEDEAEGDANNAPPTEQICDTSSEASTGVIELPGSATEE